MIQSSNYVILKAGDVTKIVVTVTKIDRGLGRKWSWSLFWELAWSKFHAVVNFRESVIKKHNVFLEE